MKRPPAQPLPYDLAAAINPISGTITPPRFDRDAEAPDKLPEVLVGDVRFQPLPEDRLLPPLLVAVYSESGRLIDVQRFADPRAAYCHDVNNTPHFSTTKLLACPLVLEAQGVTAEIAAVTITDTKRHQKQPLRKVRNHVKRSRNARRK